MLMNMEICCLNEHCNVLNLVRMRINNGASMCSHIYKQMPSHIAHSNLVQSRKYHVREMMVDNVYKLVMMHRSTASTNVRGRIACFHSQSCSYFAFRDLGTGHWGI